MDFLTLAKERYSLRKFDGRPLRQADIDKILEAGIVSPTAKNLQPERIFVVQSEEGLAKLNSCTDCIYGAKTAFLICYDKNESWKRDCDGKDSGDVDCSIVATQMMLEATDIGAGTTMVMWYDSPKLREAFELPENLIDVCILTAGYPSDEAKPSFRHTQRKPVEDIVSYI